MIHPKREEWMALLYDECAPGERNLLESHLAKCEACRSSVAAWKGAMTSLDAWKLPRTRKRRGAPVVTWAAAAAILLLATVGGARVWTLEKEVRELRGELRQRPSSAAMAALRDECRQMVIAATAEQDQKRAGDRDLFAAAFERAQAAAAVKYATLRNELETVAIHAEVGFQNAQTEIATIASATRDNSLNQ